MKVIARRYTLRHSPVGFIKPVYVMNELNEWERTGSTEVLAEKFPNSGTIVVLKNFGDIFDNWDSHEFFYVEIENSGNFEEFNQNSCKYQTKGGDTQSVEKLPLLIKGNYNDSYFYLPYAGHRYIFLDDGEFVYGPISIYSSESSYDKSEEDDFEYTKEPLNTDDLNLPDKFESIVFKYERSQIESRIIRNQYGIRETEEFYISGLKDIVSDITPFDYILTETDEEIIEWSQKAFPDSFSLEQFQNWLSTNDGNSIVDKLRLSRLSRIKEKTTTWINFLESFLRNSYLASEEGNKKVEQFVRNNWADFLNDYEAELKRETIERLKEILDEKATIEKSIQQNEEKKVSIMHEIEQLTEEKTLLYSRSEELKNIESSIDERKAELNLFDDFDAAKKKYNLLLETINQLTNSADEKRRELGVLQKEYTEEAQKGSHKKIVELMPYVKALTGYIPEDPSEKSEVYIDADIQQLFSNDPVDIDFYISQAKDFLETQGRSLSEIEVANLLTCIHQNFLTIISGLPGVGKSSLARMCGNIVAPSDLSLEIPVGRGWSTKKNLLGFYNSLKGEYQLDDFGLLGKLQALDSNKEMLENLPLVLILDEANLSPVEHYWSDFLGVCDKDFGRSINISNPKGFSRVKLPDGMRFIFTINTDHTTEILSPRLIDRASIIRLEYDSLKNSDLALGSNERLFNSQYFSYQSIKSYFLPDTYMLSQSEKKIFSDIISIMGDRDVKLGRQIPVSPRKLKAVSIYCSVIRKYFTKNHENQFLALDYAILQNVLPLISGQGKGFEGRLEKLKEKCLERSLPKSGNEIEEIIARGKEFQNYSFF